MNGIIVKNKRIADRHFLLSIKLSGSFQTPRPGQFVMVRDKGHSDPLLGRPFSVYAFERRETKIIVEILYKVVGKGTLFLSMLKRGDSLEIFGPYGHAFDVFPHAEKVVLISGGIGIAPIAFLASNYRRIVDAGNVELIFYCGAKTAVSLVEVEKIKELSSDIFISTDDGSIGYHGVITDVFSKNVSMYDPENSIIYACGPGPMLKRLSDLLVKNPIPCHVLIEERMACGVGACLGCTVRSKDKNGKDAHVRVCKDGPVFNIKDIAWS
jgi:dihydroorotate dehydrogenase electron transfer subunit